MTYIDERKRALLCDVTDVFVVVAGDVTDVKQWHYREVESQVVAKHFAELFNHTSVPKKVDFHQPLVTMHY